MTGNGNEATDPPKSSHTGRLRANLNAIDFINSAFLFAMSVLLCVFPLLVIVATAAGSDIRKVIVTRLGLNAQAAKDVDGLISSGNHALASLTAVGVVVLALSATTIATTLQGWYQKVFDQPPPAHEGTRQFVNRMAWMAGLLVNIVLQVIVGRQIGPGGGHVLAFAGELVISVLFWWWTLDMLLLGKVSWRALFPAGLATALCYTGLSVFSSLFFSGLIVSDANSYGPVGVVMILLSYCIAVAVVIQLGAVLGHMWNERLPSAKDPAA